VGSEVTISLISFLIAIEEMFLALYGIMSSTLLLKITGMIFRYIGYVNSAFKHRPNKGWL
jgi:hypothetical protein